MKKRILCILLTAVMLLTLIPITAFAADNTITNGTPDSDKETNHGYIIVDDETAEEDYTVTITVVPNEGYQLKKLTVLSAISMAPPITPAQDASDKTKYTFEMPSYPVRITAEFEEKAITIADILPANFPDNENDKSWCNSNYDNVYIYKDTTDSKLIFAETNFTDGVLISSVLTNADPDPTWSDTTKRRLVYSTDDIIIQFNMTGDECDQLENIIVTHSPYAACEGTYNPPEPSHIHAFTYTASNGKITATCTAGCADGYDKNPLTLTLTPPSSRVYDGTHKGLALPANEVYAWISAGLDIPTIYYYIKQNGQSTYERLTGTPQDAGNYMAEITVDGKSAQVKFTIDKATPYIKTNPEPNDINYGQKLSDSTLYNGYVQASSTDSTLLLNAT